MSKSHHYPRAPITEAIIDIQIAQKTDLSLADLRSVVSAHAGEYPKNQELLDVSVEIETQDQAPVKKTVTGLRAQSKDQKYIFQSRFDGFSLSRLAPYASWEPFRNEARRIWTTYLSKVNPAAIKRLAVRYINRIDLPVKNSEIKEYFKTYPELSAELPQHLGGFLLQVLIPQNDISSHALINQTVIQPPGPDYIPVILDIDLFRQIELTPSTSEIWDIFEQLHARKNGIFEACITDKCRELFK